MPFGVYKDIYPIVEDGSFQAKDPQAMLIVSYESTYPVNISNYRRLGVNKQIHHCVDAGSHLANYIESTGYLVM